MEEFPSNSIEQTAKVHRPAPSDDRSEIESPVAKGEKKVVKKIVTGEAIKKKRSFGSRFREAFGVGDGRGVFESVIADILAPAFKDMIADAVIGATERAIFGEAQQNSRRSASRRGPIGSSNHIAYNRYSTRPSETRPPMSSRARATHDFGEIELPTRAQAEEVVAQMDEIIDRFGHTSVADLYAMVDLESEYTDEKWGWTDLHGADVRRTRSGTYVLILPRTKPIG